MIENITIKGAKVNNLKDISLTIPRDKLVVVTGLSGSGKSSLAFDTIYAEGQRRYVESLSSYARQFLGIMEKPDVEYIEGLSPAIAIDQKTTSKNPRSTVGTVTEIYDYLRLLYARIGVPHCPKCGQVIKQQSIDQIIDAIMDLGEGTKIQVLAPVVRAKKGEFTKLIEDAKKDGFVRIRVDGTMYDLSEDEIKMTKTKKHNIEIVVDRLVVKDAIKNRLTDSVETALKYADKLVLIDVIDGEEMLFSQNYSCPDCGISIEELSPRMFSFNNPLGACPTCSGLGSIQKIDPYLLMPDTSISFLDGGLKGMGWNQAKENNMGVMYLKSLGKHYKVDVSKPICELPEDFVNKVLYGTGEEKLDFRYESAAGVRNFTAPFEGVVNTMERRYRETSSNGMRQFYEMYMAESHCYECDGARLNKVALAVTVGDKNIHELTALSITEIKAFLSNLKLTQKEEMIAHQITKELHARLQFLIDVGLEYLTLSRSAGTLSGGEAQRIRLATQIGSGLTGVLYILDEPSIGLHQRDNEKLIATLKKLRDLGNTLIVVEHDEDTMYAADHIIDIGPGAGVHGGEVIAEGTAEEIKKNEKSITGKYLSGKLKIEVPEKRRKGNKKYLEIIGAAENNLKDVNVKIPLGKMVAVTGVSGSGKSSLINEVLYKKLANDLNRASLRPGKCKQIKGIDNLDKVIAIDQSPIGRTPRSNPATYVGVFDLIRDLFANTNEAKMRGYQKGRFSFNVSGGRCEACEGEGITRIEMHFLSDVYVPCDICNGKRYNRETLEVKYKGKNIYDVLEMTVEEALEFFANIPKIKNKIQTLYDVGLGYIKLGQSSTTLSGGEAQRIKLANELCKKSTGKTMYILDEPTTGLHSADIHKLIEILNRLVDSGNSMLIIEHNLDIIKIADYIIDIGPEGGINGGTIIAEGTPEEVAKIECSHTGRFLKNMLK